MRRYLALLLLLLSAQLLAAGTAPLYEFDDPQLRQRFQTLTELLRCPKCQSQSIGDSDAEIAADMRQRTAELLRAGKSNDEVVQYFVARYGDFVVFRPPMRWNTSLLWLAPLLVLLVGAMLVWLQLRKGRRQLAVTPDDDSETQD